MELAMNLARLYHTVHEFLSGSHPEQNILHDEWLSLVYLNRDLRRLAPKLQGKILDVGCGTKPYKSWFPNVSEYIGLDIKGNNHADVQIDEDSTWPLENEEFDGILSFQVFEHIKNIDVELVEIGRVLKPGGIVYISMPFCAYEHGSPGDYRRLTVEGVKNLFADFEFVEVLKQGGIGSTVGTLVLRWIRLTMISKPILRILWGLLIPAWLVLSLLINIVSMFIDLLDRTGSFYQNVFLVARKAKS
jgi:SAM-dependent methyltransferase